MDVTDRLYLDQYLKTAAPHIFAEYAVGIRYRLCCSTCSRTLTFSKGFFSKGFGVEQNGAVEWELQEFIKEHKSCNPLRWEVKGSRTTTGATIQYTEAQHDLKLFEAIQRGVSQRKEERKEPAPPKKRTGRRFR